MTWKNDVAEVGLHPQHITHQLDILLGREAEQVTSHVVLQDLEFDADNGIRMSLMIALLTPTRVIAWEGQEATLEDGPTDLQTLAGQTRIIPLSRIQEARLVTYLHKPSEMTYDRTPHVVKLDIVTNELGVLEMDNVMCGEPTVDGTHLDDDVDLAALEASGVGVERCTTIDGMRGMIRPRSVVLVEEESMSDANKTAQLMEFASELSQALALR